MNIKNPYVFWTVLAVVAIGAFVIGNSSWAKSLIGKLFGGNDQPSNEGQPCTTDDNKAGHIVGGKCVADPTGDLPVNDMSTERTSNSSTNTATVPPQQNVYQVPVNTPTADDRSQAANAPNSITLPMNANCVTYTKQNPYKSMGCSYAFVTYTYNKNVRSCRLDKISCP